jgi:hypothetical protein
MATFKKFGARNSKKEIKKIVLCATYLVLEKLFFPLKLDFKKLLPRNREKTFLLVLSRASFGSFLEGLLKRALEQGSGAGLWSRAPEQGS